MSGAARGLAVAAGAAVAALAAAMLVVADPWLSAQAPAALWRITRLREAPLQAAPLIVALLGLVVAAGLALAARPPRFETAFFVLVFATAQANGIGVGPLDLFDLAFFGMLALWVGVRGLDPDRPVAVSPLLLLSLLIVLFGVLHLMVQSPGRWTIGMFGLVRAVLVGFLIVDLLRTPGVLRFALAAYIAVAVISAAIAIVQFALAYFGVFYFTLLVPPESAFKPTPIGFVMRASGLCITAQHLSSFLLFATPLALWRFSERWLLRDAVVLFVLWAGILVSWNFGAMFAAAAIGALFLPLRWPNLLIHFVALGLTALVAAYFTGLLDLIYDLSFGDAGVAKGVDQRHTLFSLGIDKLDRNPWVGEGPQGFASFSGNFWGRPVHNAFGQAATEYGVGGALVLAAIIATLVTQLILTAFRPGPHQAAVKQMLMVMLATVVLMQSEPNLDHGNTWLMLGLAQGVVRLADSGDQDGERHQRDSEPAEA